MRFQNPLNTLCPACGIESRQNVADLILLVAHCPSCGGSLDSIGLEMRKAHDDWGAFCLKMDLALSLEKHLACEIGDEELVPLNTLADFITLVDLRLSETGASSKSARELVLLAAEEVRDSRKAGRLARRDWKLQLDEPLVNALKEGRWTRHAVEAAYPRHLT